MTARLKLAFLASRNGSAFRAAVEAAGAGRLAADIVLLVSNSAKAPALDFARERGMARIDAETLYDAKAHFSR